MEAVQTVVGVLTDTSAIYIAIHFLEALAIRKPKAVIPFDDKLIAAIGYAEYGGMMVAGVLSKLAIDEVISLKF